MEERNNESSSLEQLDQTQQPPTEQLPEPPKKRRFSLQRLISRVNIYFLLFLLILLLAVVIVVVSRQRSIEESGDIISDIEELTPEELEQIRGSDASVGDPKQNLTIESNAIFAGKVLVRDSLDVAGTIRVGGALNLPGITVSGTSAFDQVTANDLSVAGDASIQGALTIDQGLAVSGSGTFGGPLSAPELTINQLNINSDLTFGRHLDAGGSTPGRTNGSALGSGGTTSVSGTDSAGTLTVNIGGGPGPGCFATISFSQAFNDTPHIVVTPVGSAAAGLNYYINRSSTTLSICSTNAAPAGSSFSFDWIAID